MKISPKFIVILFITFSTNLLFSQNQLLDGFYYSSHEPKELNEDSFERLSKTMEAYILQHGDVKGFDEHQFVFEYNYFLDRINRSGNVFYDDSISKYLNRLKNWILNRNGITTPITVYLTDYTELNAFTNDFGSIYVNIATVAKLNSEKELLIILAHEIGHIISHHSRATELYSNLIKGKMDLNREESNFKLHAFSRSQELSADSVAFVLLNGVIQQSDFEALFDKLKHSENPSYSGMVDLHLLHSRNSIYESFLKESYDSFARLPKAYQVISDSLSTHPTIESRKQYTYAYFSINIKEGLVYVPLEQYDKIKHLSALVLLNSYIQKNDYVEALDLLLKLRAIDDNEYLISMQSKLMNLITQDKYLLRGPELIEINIGCNDNDFIRFKQFIQSMSKVDFNIIAYDLLKSQEQTTTSLTASHENINFQLFFDNNPNLFVKDTTKISYSYVNWESGFDSCNWLHDEELKVFYTILDSLNYGDYCFDIPMENSHLLKDFLNSRILSPQEDEYLISYFAKSNNQITDPIAMSDIELFLHPAFAADQFFRGSFLKSSSFDPSKKAVLVQSDNLFFESEDETSFKLNYEKSLKLESRLFDLSDRYNSFSKNYSMLYGGKTTVLDNFLHKIILIWMFERVGNNKYTLSPVDDEINRYLIQQQIDYVVYRVSILNRNKGRGRKYNINYYEIYFDIRSGSAVYVARIGSKQFPDRFQIEQMVYLSELHKKQKL